MAEMRNPLAKLAYVVQFAFKVVLYIVMDKIDRTALLKLFYENFAGAGGPHLGPSGLPRRTEHSGGRAGSKV